MLEHHIEYYDEQKTKKHYEYWRLDDKLHRENGPAYIHYYKNGNIHYQQYCLNGQLHNLKGPAFVFYNKDGTVSDKHYYINNIPWSKTKWRKLRKEMKC